MIFSKVRSWTLRPEVNRSTVAVLRDKSKRESLEGFDNSHSKTIPGSQVKGALTAFGLTIPIALRACLIIKLENVGFST